MKQCLTAFKRVAASAMVVMSATFFLIVIISTVRIPNDVDAPLMRQEAEGIGKYYTEAH
jgi:hypothetical protein